VTPEGEKAVRAVVAIVTGAVTAKAIYALCDALMGPPPVPPAWQQVVETTCTEIPSSSAADVPMEGDATRHNDHARPALDTPPVSALFTDAVESRHASTVRLPGDPTGRGRE